MTDRKGTIRKGTGIDKGSRFDNKLLNGDFNIDQRSMSDLLAYIIEYSNKINFFNTENEAEGNWSELLQNDPTFCMVEIVSERLQILDELIQDRKRGEDEFLKTILILFRWAKKIEHWYHVLNDSGNEKIANEIVNMLKDGLGDHFNFIEQIINQWTAVLEKTDSNRLMSLIASYQSLSEQEQQKQLHHFVKYFKGQRATFAEKEGEFQNRLYKSLALSRSAIERFQNFVQEQLENHLLSNNTHEPHTALYITFAVLFQKAQTSINQLSRRHLDYFYRDVLKQKEFNGAASEVVLAFDLVKGVGHSTMPKGTDLTAGLLFGSATDVGFKTKKTLDLYEVQLEELHTLLFHSNQYIDYGTKKPLVSQVLKSNLVLEGKEVTKKEKWFVFGANKHTDQRTIVDQEKTGSIGFIVGSPVLFLKEGQRNIQIDIQFEPNAFGAQFDTLVKQIMKAKEITLEQVVFDLFSEGFCVFYTSKKGWNELKKYEVQVDTQTCTLSIQINLKSKDPLLVLGQEEQGRLKWPSIKVMLDEFAPYYLYSLFQKSTLKSINIKVEVQRLRNLSLYNNIGKMPADKPFDLFGPLAEEGAFLMFGNNELFQKKLNQLEVEIEWDNLPQVDGGFDAYYQGYTNPIHNQDPKVRFSVLSNSYWLPTNDQEEQEAQLFGLSSTLNEAGFAVQRLHNVSKISVEDLDHFTYTSEQTLKEPLVYDISTQTGFFRFKLVAPNQGFGLKSYQETAQQVAFFNAHNKTNIPTPNPPYVPRVRQISVNYSAVDELYFQTSTSKSNRPAATCGELMQVTPFGIEPVLQNGKVEKQSLFCAYDFEGYLLMGLTGLKDQTTIAVYFDFLNSSTTNKINKIKVKWEYYNGFKWTEIEPENVLIDETNSFNRSGIVEIILPKVASQEIRKGKSIYWLRVSTPKYAAHYPKIRGIYFNAVRAYCTTTNKGVIGKEIPENSISKISGNLLDIKKVHQPTVSIGGVQPENGEDFYMRVSERLRHKGRAVSALDYERLLMEHFDEVSMAKCTNLDKNFKPRPGKLKVVVLSSKWTIEERYYFSNEQLDRMTKLLQGLSSPLIEIEVINPEVEYLLVNCQVNFRSEFNGGYYIEQLNKEIAQYISPMTHLDIGAGGIGGRIVPNMIVSFVEELEYIDSVEELNVEHIIRDATQEGNEYTLCVYQYGQELKAFKPWSVLVSVKKHNILVKNQPGHIEDLIEVGIGNLEIGLDFIIDKKAKEEEQIMNQKFQTEEASKDTAFFIIKHNSLKE